MSRFAPYEPDSSARHSGAFGFSIRALIADDVEALSTLIAEREQLDPIQVRLRLRRELHEASPERALFAAVQGTALLGFARVAHWDELRLLSAHPAPPGFYLLGVLVRPDAQRRGVAQALTRARFDWLKGKTHEVFYFANARNRASIALHERFGFERMQGHFELPGVSFEGGEGQLFRAPVPA